MYKFTVLTIFERWILSQYYGARRADQLYILSNVLFVQHMPCLEIWLFKSFCISWIVFDKNKKSELKTTFKF